VGDLRRNKGREEAGGSKGYLWGFNLIGQICFWGNSYLHLIWLVLKMLTTTMEKWRKNIYLV
jgi:hypothetical protein